MRRQLSYSGIGGPVVFIAAVLIAAGLRSDYDHVGQMLSELGASGAPNAWLMNYMGFAGSGVLIALFGLSLLSLRRGALAVLGTLLVVLFGVSMIAAGVFSCDASCVPVSPTPEQLLHERVSQLAFFSLIASTLVWGTHFVRADGGRGFGAYSLVSGVVAIGLLVGFIRSIEGGGPAGLLQRALVGVLFAWLAVFSARVGMESSVGREDHAAT